MKIIHRYLPREVGELLVYYLWLVLPLQQKIEAELQKKDSRSQHMWPTDPGGKKWTSPRMREVMKRESNIGMGVQLTIQAWRDLAIGISRHYMREKQTFTDDDNDEDSDVSGDDDIWDLAAGHTSQVAGAIYARGIREKDGVIESMRQQFRKVSETWHQFLKFQSSLEVETRPNKRKKALFDDEREGLSTDRRKKLKKADALRELKRFMGDETEFRGIQQDAVSAVMRGDPRVAAVMGTGGGKSLIFMLPAFCTPGGTTIVVVPLIALRQDLTTRCNELGINCVEWDRRRPPFGAKIVMVTSEAAISPSFINFANQLKGTQQLNRIVIDECHVILNDQVDFRPKLREMWRLNWAQVQIVMLTATLPVSMEEIFWERMEVKRLEVSLFRMSTTRTNVQYQIYALEKIDTEARNLTVIALVKSKLYVYPQGKIVVYCNSVVKANYLADGLDCKAFYHDVDIDQKKRILKDFATGVSKVVVATSAFGLGIDIPDIRVVIHADVPRTLIDYAQESGRAGRDGLKSEAIIVARHGLIDPRQNDIEPETTIENGIELNVMLVQKLLRAGCKRVVLDKFFDGREDRVACEKEEEKCQNCEIKRPELQAPPKSMHENSIIHLSEEEESTNLESNSDGNSEEERAAIIIERQNRLAIRIRIRAQEKAQSQSEEAEALLRHLRKVKSYCAVCTRKNSPHNVHSIFWCPSGEKAVQEYKKIKQKIRGGSKMQNYGGCYKCFIPQAWCNKWDPLDKTDTGFQENRQECQFQDMILGGYVTWGEHPEYQKGRAERIRKAGSNPNNQDQLLRYLGTTTNWGGLQVWVLLLEYWEAVKVNGQQ
jgi:RecQ family ATP-dependent DNA helicase